jgi:hypothetical protein
MEYMADTSFMSMHTQSEMSNAEKFKSIHVKSIEHVWCNLISLVRIMPSDRTAAKISVLPRKYELAIKSQASCSKVESTNISC